jgi:hypothetical protein
LYINKVPFEGTKLLFLIKIYVSLHLTIDINELKAAHTLQPLLMATVRISSFDIEVLHFARSLNLRVQQKRYSFPDTVLTD